MVKKASPSIESYAFSANDKSPITLIGRQTASVNNTALEHAQAHSAIFEKLLKAGDRG